MQDGQGATRLARRVARGAAGRVAAGVLVIAAVTGWAPGRSGALAAPGDRASAPATLTTPVLSARRVPQWVAGSVAAARLQDSVGALWGSPALRVVAARSCLLVSRGAQPLVADNPAGAVDPASNMKILTAVAALDRLGPDYRYTTVVRADAPPVAGRVTGNLYLVGGGDPILRTPDFVAALHYPEALYTPLQQLVAQVKAAGIAEVTGAVVGDETRYDTQRTVAGWKPGYSTEGDVGPLSALDVNDGFQRSPAGFVAAPQPATAAAATFSALLVAAGVKVDRPAATGPAAPAAPVVTSLQSAPLAAVLGAVLRPSDDTGAEVVTKELGRVSGAGGSTAAGVAAIRGALAAAGLPVDQLTAVDGSGLAPGDRVTCQLISATLAGAGPASALAADLPVGGRSGTLYRRMLGTPAAGRIEAKTGTLADVSALSGFALPAVPTAGAPLVFSFIANGVTNTTGASLGDRLAVDLAAYPQAPPVAALEPLPPTPAAGAASG